MPQTHSDILILPNASQLFAASLVCTPTHFPQQVSYASTKYHVLVNSYVFVEWNMQGIILDSSIPPRAGGSAARARGSAARARGSAARARGSAARYSCHPPQGCSTIHLMIQDSVGAIQDTESWLSQGKGRQDRVPFSGFSMVYTKAKLLLSTIKAVRVYIVPFCALRCERYLHLVSGRCVYRGCVYHICIISYPRNAYFMSPVITSQHAHLERYNTK